MTNTRVGNWLILQQDVKDNKKYICKCLSCGNIYSVNKYNLKNGTSKQCGNCHDKGQDLTNLQIGQWKILYKNGKNQYNKILWKCECSCGFIKDIVGTELLKKRTLMCRNCSNINNANKKNKNHIGQQFGNWTIISRALISTKDGKPLWITKCKCGNLGRRTITDLNRGKNTGCYSCNAKLRKGIKYKIKINNQQDLKYRIIFKLKFRNKILNRDLHSCVICNNDINLEVHHIEKWVTNQIDRFNEQNCVTLCKSCHLLIHNYYYKGNVNIELTNYVINYIKLFYENNYTTVTVQ